MDQSRVVPLTPTTTRSIPVSDHPYETETFWASFHDPARAAGRLVLQPGAVQPGRLQRRRMGLGRLDRRARSTRCTTRPAVAGHATRWTCATSSSRTATTSRCSSRCTKYRVRRSRPRRVRGGPGLRGGCARRTRIRSAWRRSGAAGTSTRHARHRADRAARRDDRNRLVLRAGPLVGSAPGPRPPGSRSGARRVRRAIPTQVTRPPYSPFGIGYVFGTQDADEMFLAYTLPCIWDGAGARPRDHRIPRARRHVRPAGRRRTRCEFDPRRAGCARSGSTPSTSTAASCPPSGELVSHHGEHGQGTGYFHWEWNGARGYGEDQSTARGEVLDSAESRRALALSIGGDDDIMSQQTAERALPYLINDADEHSTPSRGRVRALHRPRQARHGDPLRARVRTAGKRSATTGDRRGSPSRTSRSSAPTSSSPTWA